MWEVGEGGNKKLAFAQRGDRGWSDEGLNLLTGYLNSPKCVNTTEDVLLHLLWIPPPQEVHRETFLGFKKGYFCGA